MEKFDKCAVLPITGDTIDIQSYYDYWEQWKPLSPPVTQFQYYHTHTVEDKGVKALSIIKIMMEKKLIKLDTIEQFIEAMDLLVKVL